MPRRFEDLPVEEALAIAGVELIRAGQYMDKWRLDHEGMRPIENHAAKQSLGLEDVQSLP